MNDKAKLLDKLRAWSGRTDIKLPQVYLVTFSIVELRELDEMLHTLAISVHRDIHYVNDDIDKEAYTTACTVLGETPDLVLTGEKEVTK